MFKFTRAFVFVAVAFSFLLAACGTASTPAAAGAPATQAPGSVTLTGTGSTFQFPAEQAYAEFFPAVDPSVVINYTGTGSGAGKKAIIDGTVDFAGSDAVLNPDEITAGKDLQIYPFLAGATVMAYNLPSLDPKNDPKLILDGKTLADIYMGKITMWNDPAILALNPKIASKLPAQPIFTVHRADGSGTTEIFTNALTAFSSDWTAGHGTVIDWPTDKAGTGKGGNGNPGVTAEIAKNQYSLGYVEYAYAVQNNLPFAQMVNKAGNVVTASPDSTKAAMTDFANAFTPQLTAVIVDAPGAQSWPIAGYTYIIIHQTSMTDCVKAQKLVEYIHWILTNPAAIKYATDLGFIPLPDAVQQKVLGTLSQVTCNGQPVHW
ncbi:MAG: phosphate ABC transporter substrate-binding protein PstS [Chloroflexi bacterium]|nr:phosphate ABC transporter substrate-binding protein PstS [Chloroflexota bacterium]